MRIHPRKEAGIVVDFVPKGATHTERVVSLHSLLNADFYREGARVTPAPRRRTQRRGRRKLTPANWLVPVTPDVARRLSVIQREWQRIDPKYLDDDEQRFWATIAGRQMRFDERQTFVQKFTAQGASKGALETFLATCAAQNPNRRLRLDRARRPRLDAGRSGRLRRPRDARHPGSALGEGSRRRRAPAAARDRRGQARRPRPDPRPLDMEARARRAQDTRPQGLPGVPGREAAARRARELARPAPRGERRPARQGRARRCRARSARRCSQPPRATRRGRPTRSTRRASSSARSRRSPRRSPTTYRRRRPGPTRSRRRRRGRRRDQRARRARVTADQTGARAARPGRSAEGDAAARQRASAGRRAADAAAAAANAGEQAASQQGAERAPPRHSSPVPGRRLGDEPTILRPRLGAAQWPSRASSRRRPARAHAGNASARRRATRPKGSRASPSSSSARLSSSST